MYKIIFLFSIIFSNNVLAKVDNQTKIEIEQLFNALNTSKCEFQRNNNWYSSQKASNHLKQKYEYLIKKDILTTTESFIEYAASKSSMSGIEYKVKCNNQTSSSKKWFLQQLNLIRDKK